MLGLRAATPVAVAPPAPADGLEGAYEHCRRIAQRHAKTFYLSSRFLAPAKRRAIWAVYAFCRTADDIVDRIAPGDERLAALAIWENGLLDAYRGRPADPVFVALADAAERFAIPLEPALDLLRGARLDVTVRRYATYDDVSRYCYLVASTVGLLTAPVLGYRDPAALPYAIELGRAMQLTNILRDIGEDALLDRIYLPAEDMARFGYGEDDLRAGCVDGRFVDLMRHQIARCRAIYREAEPGIALLDRESRYTVRLAATLYARILDAIERNGYDVYSRRAFVPTRTKAYVACREAFAGTARA